MSAIKRLAVDAIDASDRRRPVDRDHVLFIAASIASHGLLNPITVRATPNGAKPWTLVAGAHRLMAVESLDEAEIDAIVVKADRIEGQLIEIEENLCRNDMTALERADFVQGYRDLWEEKYGKITRGGDQSGKLPLCSMGENFSQSAGQKLGISRDALFRLQRIAQHLPRDLRAALHGTPTANNQARLLKLVNLGPDRLANAAAVFRHCDGDYDKAMAALTGPRAELDAQGVILDRLLSTWERANAATRARFLAHVGAER